MRQSKDKGLISDPEHIAVISESIRDGQNDSKLTMSDGEKVTISKKMLDFARTS